MAANAPVDLRLSERRLFALTAAFFALIILIGFARTYYLKFAFGNPPVRSLLVHVHGALMTTWILFFISQVWFIRTRRVATHMRNGMIAVGLAVAMIAVGFFTAVAAAKNPGPAAPPAIPPLSFLAVPLFDLVLFAILFGAAIYYRRQPANHKRLLLLTVLNFLPPAIARFPFEPFISGGPPVFFGIPAVITIGLLVYDTWLNRRLNKLFLAGSLLLIASYPLRLVLSGTDVWISFATWLTTWAA
jgi:hypothetical protein